MPALQNNGGDVLARGGVRATFRPMGEALSKEKWEKMKLGETVPPVMAKYLFKCPVHGVYESDREFVLFGDGYPKLNEFATGKCPKEECGEKSVYEGYIQLNVAASGDASVSAGTSGPKPGKTRRSKKSS